MSEKSVITQQMRDAIGVESEPGIWDVEKGDIVRFAEAIGDSNPLFSDEQAARRKRYGGIIAAPTFLHALLPGPSKAEFEQPYPTGLDGGSEWEYFEPVRPGDRITVTAKIVDLHERQGRLGNMLFVVREIRYVNHLGDLVAERRSTGIFYQPPSEAG